jgi:hypothetical protein
MKRNNKIEITEKFWEGKTSLSEEEMLLSSEKLSGETEGEDAYFHYVYTMRSQTFDGENKIWAAIAAKRNKKRNLYYFIGVAASILIFLGFFSLTKNENNPEEKEAQFALIEQTLQQAATGITAEIEPAVKVLYEDEMIVIVADN